MEKMEYCLINMHKTIIKGMVANSAVDIAAVILLISFLKISEKLSGFKSVCINDDILLVYTRIPRVAAKDIQKPASITVPGINKIRIVPESANDVKGSGERSDSQARYTKISIITDLAADICIPVRKR